MSDFSRRPGQLVFRQYYRFGFGPCGGETWLKAAAVAAVVWIGARCMIHPRAAATEQLSCDKNTICHASALRVKDFSFSDDSNMFFLSGC